LVNCTNATYSGTNNAATNNASGIFTVVGAGAHYLPSDSRFRSLGNTNVAILGELRRRTTTAPFVMVSNIISWNTNFIPVVPRSAGAPDLGWHAPVIDLAVNALIISNATQTVEAGTAIATFGNDGIRVHDGGGIVCRGSPTNMIHLCRFYAAQALSTN